MNTIDLYNWAPALRVMGLGLLIALGPLCWVWLIQDDAPVSPSLMPALTQATVLRVKAQDLTKWLSPGKDQPVENHLFLVDPLGNLMMRFPANMDVAGAAKAKRDIERVLRASAFWDTPGR